MKKILIVCILLSSMMFMQCVCADEVGIQHVSNAKNFSVDGVKLGMTIDDFKKLYPSAETFSDLSDTGNNLQGFRVDSTANTDGIDAAFWEGKLLEFYVWYLPPRTEQMGGYYVISTKLVEKFGKGDADSKGTADSNSYSNGDSLYEIHWLIPNANFLCLFEVWPKRSIMRVVNVKAYTRLNDSKAKKANVGF